MTLADYVTGHTVRGECQCGRCADRGTAPEPVGHTVDMVFFKVAPTHAPDAATFRQLTAAHRGEWADENPLDGAEHNYLALGAWIGDQGLALQYMALGTALGVFTLLTPVTMLPAAMLTETLVRQMAGAGYVAVQAVPS